MFAPLLAALTLAASAESYDAPPAPEAVPAPAACEAPAMRELPRALAAYLAACRPVAVIDGPGTQPEWIEIAMPAGMPMLREVRSETLLTVPRSTSLAVNNFAGTIVVRAWKRNDVRIVAVHGRRARLDPRIEDGTLVVAVVDRHGEPAFGDVAMNVPEWMAMRLSSVESAIVVEGVRAAIEAGSVRGDVMVRQSRGPLELNSVEGGVRVLDARGRVRVASINNVVRLERVIGLIDAESVNGDIQLSQVDSPDVDASSVNGSVDFFGPFQPRGRYRLASHSGNLRVGVPVGAGVDVSVATFNGAFESGIPVQRNTRTNKGRSFTFTLGGGGSSLELQSFQGLIQLLRDDGVPVAPRPPAPPAPAPVQREGDR